MRELSQRSANLRLHLGPRKNEGIAESSASFSCSIAEMCASRSTFQIQYEENIAQKTAVTKSTILAVSFGI
jgi:hypothetical protein